MKKFILALVKVTLPLARLRTFHKSVYTCRGVNDRDDLACIHSYKRSRQLMKAMKEYVKTDLQP